MSMSDKEKQKQMQAFLNRKRKIDLKGSEDGKVQEPSSSSEPKSQDDMDPEKKKKKEQYEKAKKALLFDAKRAKDRADLVGPQGYLKPKSLSTNKQFLRRTIEATLPRRKKEEPPNKE